MARRGKVAVLWDQWRAANDAFFGGKLDPPAAIRIVRATKYHGKYDLSFMLDKKTGEVVALKEVILISAHTRDKLATLLHEMVHQYQATVLALNPDDHGWSFRGMAKHIERRTGLKLR